MEMIHRLIITFVANAIAFLLAGYFLPNFTISGNITDLAIVIGLLTLINLILKPVIRLILGPLVLITLGLFNIVINGFIIYVIDFYFENIKIDDIVTLLYVTLIVGLVNLILGGGRLFKK